MTETIAPPKKRIDSIDILRGLVMIIMALDHTRDFFGNTGYEPTDLSKASTALFLTRFITHYCAATFVFLAGAGAFLSLNRGKTKAQASSFLLSRGLWLIFLEVTIIGLAWGGPFLQVIWVIGVSMVILSGLIFLPRTAIAIFGLLLIFGHDIFDRISPSAFTGVESSLWTFLHVPGMLHLWGNAEIFLLYPLVPWVGVMATGYCFGGLFLIDAAKRKKILLMIGLSAIALFIVLRYFNNYGDPEHWMNQGNLHRTILSFINVSKYPPSLEYLLITLGPAIVLLPYLENISNAFTNILVLFGRVALFYYILHLYLIHGLALLAEAILKPANGLHAGLPVVYLVWALVVFILYFPCRWFMKYKREHKYWWLSYL